MAHDRCQSQQSPSTWNGRRWRQSGYGQDKRGPNTKIHLAVDAKGMPARIFVTAGTVNDCTKRRLSAIYEKGVNFIGASSWNFEGAGYIIRRRLRDMAAFYIDYELRDLSTVEGYELQAVAVPFFILEDGSVIEIPITNLFIYGGVSILKTDRNSTSLFGAVFGLYNGQEQLISKLTADEDGRTGVSGLEHTAPISALSCFQLISSRPFLPDFQCSKTESRHAFVSSNLLLTLFQFLL